MIRTRRKGKRTQTGKAVGRIWNKTVTSTASWNKRGKDISDYFKAGNTREDFLKLFIDF